MGKLIKYFKGQIMPSKGEMYFYGIDKNYNQTNRITDPKKLRLIIKSFNGLPKTKLKV